jgi:uncharacterized protein (TIGR03067 family)
MRYQLILAVLAFTVAPDDRDQMQGVWLVESLQEDGRAAPDEKAVTEVVIKENQFIVKYATLQHEAINNFRLDGSKEPKGLDIITPELGRPLLGIYQLEGDTLRICWSSTPGGQRPDAFATKVDSGRRLAVLKRKK